MATKEAQMVKLTQIRNKKVSREFSIEHALNLLRMPSPTWKLDDKNFKFEKNDLVKQSGS